MKNLLKKLAQAKMFIATQKNAKDGKNSFSNYSYFTPEQVNKLTLEACDSLGLLTKFDLNRNEYGVYGTLTVYDTDSGESIDFTSATAIPEIKATNVAQQMGGCMTYTERYLKMTAFGISDNSLDFDSNESYKARKEETFADTLTKKDMTKIAKEQKKTVEADSKSGEWYEKALKGTDFMLKCLSEDDFLSKIKSKYSPTTEQEKNLRIAYNNAKQIESLGFNDPFNN